ncbi:MAG: ubiquinol-cytochrome c reductase iron-sulfur subunit [Gemmatimonadales bacterium]
MSQGRSGQDCADCLATDPSSRLRAIAAAEEGIGRRAFLVQSGFLAALAALAACTSGSGSTAPNVPANTRIDIGNYPALANVGGVAIVSVGGAPLAIIRTSASSFIALSRVCPHQGGIVNQSGSRFVCPVHGATFDLNGNWIGGQPTSNLRQYSTTYDSASNTLTID